MSNIWVIGGTNIDVQATSFNKLIQHDSNPGKVSYSIGGVAHNIASNLGKLHCPVKFITAFSNDIFSKMAIEDCLNNNLDISFSQEIKNSSSSLYLAVAQPNGEMNVAIADMEILTHLDIEKILMILQEMDSDDLVVVDTNLTSQQLSQIITNCKGKIYCDPISTIKARKILPFLDKLEVLKPNLIEAQTLLDTSSNDHHELLKGFLSKGVKNIIISMSQDGIIAANSKEAYHLSNIHVSIKNTTGAGDAFMAGYLFGQYSGKSFLDSLKYALASASMTIESLKTVSDDMNRTKLEQYFARVEAESNVTSIML